TISACKCFMTFPQREFCVDENAVRRCARAPRTRAVSVFGPGRTRASPRTLSPNAMRRQIGASTSSMRVRCSRIRSIALFVVGAIGKALHLAVTGDRAYAVYPTRYSYTQNGKPVKEEGVWTFALQKVADGWRIAGWAWAQH